MKESHIKLLRCVSCGSPLGLSGDFPSVLKDGKIESGVLACFGCKADYPIIKGVGVFFPSYIRKHYLNEEELAVCKKMGLDIGEAGSLEGIKKRQLNVARKWSYQWNDLFAYSTTDLEKQDLYGRDSFLKFIPIDTSGLGGKTIVIWCGGRGREAYHLARYKPGLLVINEIGDQIYGIPEIIGDDADLLLIRSDMTVNPLIDGFADYSICDHALQHVADHRLGYKKLVDVLKPGGTAAINVYSYENNILMTHLIEPLKGFFHAFPVNGQRWISIMPAISIYFLIHLFYVPMGRVLGRARNKLFLYDYMVFRSRDSFKNIWVSCFDLIHAPISYHFKKREILELAVENSVSVSKLDLTNKTTWSMVGLKK